MRSRLIILGIFTVFSCKAQQMLSLNASVYNSPTNSYFKDINNELDPYIGVWKASFQGKIILIKIIKELKVPFEMWGKNNFKDRLLVRYEIINNNGVILESSLNNNFNTKVKLLIEGSEIEDDLVKLIFAGGNCSVGIGEIILRKVNGTKVSWSYYPGTTTMNDKDCPPNLDYTIYLPETENLIFTKQ
ncbi:hypothetical protein EG347_09950 [Chryseobacterium sp. G0186]|uniref:DUF6705 family protein n=1 Tax=Chryseobacterium sp. G0186 TaxID=2487064 RepID=UPI000F4ECCDB|nr:DUF6705 family protein [Chryseobacterium sp. G0186]AZA77817.1 hypothetical protein EG347_09950 [Chryseobacterium sp. G0186]